MIQAALDRIFFTKPFYFYARFLALFTPILYYTEERAAPGTSPRANFSWAEATNRSQVEN